jgi:hypothetical protein
VLGEECLEDIAIGFVLGFGSLYAVTAAPLNSKKEKKIGKN